MNEKKDDATPVNPHTGRPLPEEALAGIERPVAPEDRRTESPDAGAGSSVNPGPAAAPSQQELAVRSALETVMDPEIGLSVIDLGLIRTVDIQPGKTRIEMLLTTPFCPYAPQMMADVKQATQSVLPQDCEVEILPDAWSPELMPDPGLLGYSF